MRLFRYLDAKGLILSILGRRLKVSRLLDLNDPFEWRFGITGIPDETETAFADVIQQCLVRYNEISGLICYSASPSKSVLWSHYADRHRGGVLEFEAIPDLETFPKIEYEDERVSVAMEEILTSDTNVLADRMVNGLWQRKSKGWDYEEEYRQYITLDACETAGGMYFVRLRPDSLRRVLLGWRSEIEVEMMRELLHFGGYTNCPVVRGRPGRTSYAVEF